MKKHSRLILILFSLVILAGQTFAGGTGKILNNPIFQAVDSQGIPMAGGLLYSYVPGTTTAKETYSDRACTVANTNPIVLDSNGQAVIYLKGATKLNLTDSSGEQQTNWPLDYVNGADEASFDYYYPDYNATDHGATGSNNTLKYYIDTYGTDSPTIVVRHNSGSSTTTYTLTTSETVSAGVVLRIEPGAIIDGAGTLTFAAGSKLVTVDGTKTFGSSITVSGLKKASPDMWAVNTTPGTTDMYSGIAKAIAATSGSGYVVFMPGTTYAIGTKVQINSTAGVPFKFDMNNSTLVALAGLTGTMVEIQNPHGLVPTGFDFGNGTINCNTIAGTGFLVKGSQHAKYHDFKVSGAASGSSGAVIVNGDDNYGVYYNSFDNIFSGKNGATNAGVGFVIRALDANYRIASNTFKNCTAQYNQNDGWSIDYASGVFDGCNAEANDYYGFDFDHTYDIVFIGGYSENNHQNIATDGTSDATDDISFNLTSSSTGVKIYGGRHAGSISGTTTGLGNNFQPTNKSWSMNHNEEGLLTANGLTTRGSGSSGLGIRTGTMLGLSTASEVTISSGAVVPTKTFHTVDTEADAASDDLDTITTTNIEEGDIIVLKPADGARTVIVKDGTGNILSAGDFSMDNGADMMFLLRSGSNMIEVSRSDNGS